MPTTSTMRGTRTPKVVVPAGFVERWQYIAVPGGALLDQGSGRRAARQRGKGRRTTALARRSRAQV